MEVNVIKLEYRIVKQQYYKGDYKTEIIECVDSYYFAIKEFKKYINNNMKEIISNNCTIAIMNDFGKILLYVHSVGE